MSKRKNRNQSPNIPQSTLDLAREEANAAAPNASNELDEIVEAVDDTPVVQFREPPRVAVERRPRPTRSTGGRPASNARNNRKEEKHDLSYIRNRLAHPTRIVTEAQLREEYSYVINDLRSMGILAAVLIVALVVIEKLV